MSKVLFYSYASQRHENIFEIKHKPKLTTVNWQIVPRFT